MHRFTVRPLAVAGAGIGIALLAATPATAGPSSDPGAVKAAVHTADATHMIANFFVNLDQRAAGSRLNAPNTPAALAAKNPRILSEPVAEYTVNPAFVAGTSTEVTVFDGYAVEVASSSGQHATAILRQNAGSWRVDQVNDGRQEIAYAAEAAGSPMFNEPAINAWYALRGQQVTALNDTARGAVGDGMSVTDYQRRLHARYADKMAGSQYVADGKYGGYGPEARTTRPTESGVTTALAAGGVLAAAGALVFWRRRRTA